MHRLQNSLLLQEINEAMFCKFDMNIYIDKLISNSHGRVQDLNRFVLR
jgi:hypothetical protein